ncbi:NYN domain-containing protein [Aliivibrio fischeri]|uniref:NYN domain-containing protein n=1 Tax=Aliivibrio fischeri TaxID=668 RepID=UPI00107E6D66|nr:NYN domain-containing protein [Aliivibrio fischeri]TGA68222.1 NYN domain-containing protein [Aliivibrio fischeri]
MKKENFYIAVYIDMENVCGIDFSLESIMKSCMKSENDDFNFIFAIKAAYGNQSSMPKAFKKSVVEHNFNIIDTPHISAQKNRADLLMSLDAFETLYLDTPRIDRYCFMTSDSDFTVIGDRLRKFGREVWLACRTADKDRVILSKAFDNMLLLEDYAENAPKSSDNPIESLFIEALSYVNVNKLPMNVSVINDRMKMLDPSFDVSKTPYRRFNNLVEAMQQNGHLKVEFDIRSNRVIEVNIT